MIKSIDTELLGLKIIELKIYCDERGFFTERFNKNAFLQIGIECDFVQDNLSLSNPGVLRGLHYQQNPSQVKLVGCIRGRIWDVAVDIRKSSPTFGKHYAVELSEENGKLLFIPEGFAHGFCVLGNESASVMYKVNNYFSKEGDGGILYNDPHLNIEWPIKNPTMSSKDIGLQTFAQFSKIKT